MSAPHGDKRKEKGKTNKLKFSQKNKRTRGERNIRRREKVYLGTKISR